MLQRGRSYGAAASKFERVSSGETAACLDTRSVRQPSRLPAYRENPSHTEFPTRLGCPASAIKAALQKVWHAKEPLEVIPTAAISQLVQAKCATEEWNLKW